MGKYQNVGTPRFYVDYFQYALTTGLAVNNGTGNDNIFGRHDDDGDKLFQGVDREDLQKLFYLNPTEKVSINFPADYDSNGVYRTQLTVKTYLDENDFNINYGMVLNHNLNESGCNFYTEGYNNTYARFDNKNSLVNWGTPPLTYNGWTLFEHDLPTTGDAEWYKHIQVNFQSQEYVEPLPLEIGCISIGTMYEMPHSPDLDLTMTREFGNVKRQFTKGGTLLSSYKYKQPPTWGDGEAWGLYTDAPTNLGARRAGRRTWDLKFSYLSATDIMADMEMLNLNPTEETADYESYLGGGVGEYETYRFFSQFMQKTLGGSLRFIFQPDGSDYNPDGFAICVLDQDSISIKQVAHNTYNISLRIMEAW